MRSALLMAVALVGSIGAAACGGGTPATSTIGRLNPASPGGLSTVVAGTWTGRSIDSSGTMMGAGLSIAMMNGTTWQIVQNGNTFTGTMSFAGYHRGPMTISGTVNGTTGTFTMTIPVGTMMTGWCTAIATGTFDMDDLMEQIHGIYAGSNTCTGPFDQGDITLTRR